MRYAVFVSFYIDAKDDEEAIYKAKYITARQDAKKDDSCSVDSIRRAESGRLERPEIFSKKLSTNGINC